MPLQSLILLILSLLLAVAGTALLLVFLPLGIGCVVGALLTALLAIPDLPQYRETIETT